MGSAGDEYLKNALQNRSLWATDGNVSWKKIKNRMDSGAVYYGSSSRILAEQVQHLLLRLGIQSTIRINKKEDYRDNYHVWVQGATHILNFLQNVGCYGERGKIIPEMIEAIEKIETNTNLDVIPKEAWKLIIETEKEAKGISWRTFSTKMNIAFNGSGLFKNSIGRERLQKIATVLESEKIANLANSDIYWDEIASITPREIEDVYDATVPKFSNFTTNDIIVHNSIEQDADMVLFLYRPEYYGITQDMEGNPTVGTGEVLIAKHRNGALKDVKLRFIGKFTKFENMEGDAFNFSPTTNGQNKPTGGFISSKVNNAPTNQDTSNGLNTFSNSGLTRTDDEPPF